MKKPYRLQGILFGFFVVITAFAAILLPNPNRTTELILVALFVALLGVPHGAMDALIARQSYGINTISRWVYFITGYLAAAFIVIGIWVLAPALFLIGFLVISAAHFSADPRQGALVLSRALYGGAIIILPTFLHASEVTRLFGLLAGPKSAFLIVPVLQTISFPWLLGLFTLAILETKRDIMTSIELAAIGVLATLVSPLVAFGVFFCVMHSARHFLRVANYASNLRIGRLVAFGAGPMVLVIGASVLFWFLLGSLPVDAKIVQILFVGLAALTVPHMLLVEHSDIISLAET